MYVFTIRNAGNLPADEVRLMVGNGSGLIGDGGFATVVDRDGNESHSEYKSEVPLGTLKIEDELQVFLWPNGYLDTEVTITHRRGRVVAHVREASSPMRVGLMFAAAVLAPIILGVVIEHVRDYHKMSRRLAELGASPQPPAGSP